MKFYSMIELYVIQCVIPVGGQAGSGVCIGTKDAVIEIGTIIMQN